MNAIMHMVIKLNIEFVFLYLKTEILDGFCAVLEDLVDLLEMKFCHVNRQPFNPLMAMPRTNHLWNARKTISTGPTIKVPKARMSPHCTGLLEEK